MSQNAFAVTRHHLECYEENNGCTIFGCKDDAPQKGMTDNLEGFLTKVETRRKEFASLNEQDAETDIGHLLLA